MAKKKTLDELRTETAEIGIKISDLKEKIRLKQEELKRKQNKIAEEENKQRTHNLCCLGGLVLKYFGKDISVEDFQETLDYLFSLEDVKEYFSAEKEQRFLQDNPQTENSENTETVDNNISDSYSDENDFSGNQSDTDDDEITDEKVSA